MKLLILIASVLFCLPCYAEAKKTERTCRLIFPQRQKDSPNEVYLFDGTSSQKIQLSSMNFSDVINLPEGDLVLSMIANPVEKSEDLPKGAPKVEIATNITELYLVVFSDPENSVLPIRALPLDISGKTLMLGQTLWLNLSKNRVTGELGTVSLNIGPDEHIVSKAPLSTNGYHKVKFSYLPEGSEIFLPVMSKSWWFDSSSRNLGFVFDSEIGVPQIFSFRDQRPITPQ